MLRELRAIFDDIRQRIELQPADADAEKNREPIESLWERANLLTAQLEAALKPGGMLDS